MSEFDVEMVETGADEMEVETSDGQSRGEQVSGGSKSTDSAPRAYELPWSAQYQLSLKIGPARRGKFGTLQKELCILLLHILATIRGHRQT